MLQIVHEKIKGWVSQILIAILCFVFVLWSVEYYLGSHQDSEWVAIVNGYKISAQALSLELRYQQETHDPQTAHDRALNALIERSLLSQAAHHFGFKTTLDYLKSIVSSVPDFQEQGRFSPTRFQDFLRLADMSASTWYAAFQEEFLAHQLIFGVQQAQIFLPNDWMDFGPLSEQIMQIRGVILPLEPEQQKPSLEILQDYYRAHRDQFYVPERIQLAYIVIQPSRARHGRNVALLEERLSDLALAHPDSLQAIHNAFHFAIVLSDFVTQNGKMPGILSDPEIQKAMWSRDVLYNHNNSTPIVLSDGRFMVLRVHAVQKAYVPDFQSVAHEVLLSWQKETALKKSQELATLLAEELRHSKNIDAFLHTKGLKWQTWNISRNASYTELPDLLLKELRHLVFKDQVTCVHLADGSWALAQLHAIHQPLWSEVRDQKTAQESIKNWFSRTTQALYMNSLEAQASIKLKKP